MHITEFNAADLLTELSESVIPMAVGKGLLIKYNGPETLKIEGDSIKIRRVAHNLIVNAIRYTEVGEVTIQWGFEEKPNKNKKSQKGGTWYFTVGDTGSGIPQEKVTEVTLFNSDEENKPEVVVNNNNNNGNNELIPLVANSGEGIGLYIVKRLCELLSAKMEVVSRPGEGTLFKISIPSKY